MTTIANNISDAISQARKLECELDGLYFARYFFKQRFGSKMIVNDHHEIIQNTLDRVIDGEIKRLIINISPGFSKTEFAVINFMARGLAINPSARFMHLSYSDDLALENSNTTKNIVECEEYQLMWPIKLQNDSKSKKKWWTHENGGVYATSAGGQVTGFRAGHMIDGFTGALIIDDPVKPDDAFTVELENVNNRFNNTIKSRLATEDIPIIVIMQRIHKDDLSGYLLTGGSGEKWHHLNLPVYIDENEKYPEEYTHGIQVYHGLENGWLWPFKLNETNKLSLMAHKRTWHSQYRQRPQDHDVEGALWKDELIERFRVHKIPDNVKMQRVVTAVDPSGDDGKEKNQKRKSDEIGIITCFRGTDGHYYVMDDSSLNGSPATWGAKAIKAHDTFKADCIVGEKNYGGAMVEHTIRSMSNSDNVRYKDVNSSRGKILRAEPIAALYEQGLVHHIGNFTLLESEMTTFNGKGKSPNRLDSLVFSLAELSGCNNIIKTKRTVGMY